MTRVVLRRTFLFLAVALAGTGFAVAANGQDSTKTDAKTGDEATIRAAMAAQAAAWNHDDIKGFMQTYEDSPETTFIGTTLRKGYGPILERYRKSYTTHAQMGTLSFHEIDVRLLPSACGKTEFAVVTGHFHLERSEKGDAKKDDGIFSLVWRNGPQGWKILLDHTS